MNREEIVRLLKPDGLKIGLFIGLIILILILPVFPCQVDRTVRIETQTFFYGYFNTTQEHSSYSLEIFLFAANENFEWENYYIQRSGSVAYNSNRTTIEIWEIYSSNQYSFLIFASSFIFGYFISCFLAFYGRNEYQRTYLIKKLKRENKEIAPYEIRVCQDCGADVPVMSDGSGICPGCKRGYMDNESWSGRAGLHVSSSVSQVQTPYVKVDVKHWDKYQKDMDQVCNDEKLFRFSPVLIIITIIASILFMAGSIIVAFSDVHYGDNEAVLYITGGIALNWGVSAVSGFYLGKHIKKARFGIPIIILSTLIAIYSGLYCGQEIFNAVHPDLRVRFIVELFSTTFICIVASMVSFSKYHFDQT